MFEQRNLLSRWIGRARSSIIYSSRFSKTDVSEESLRRERGSPFPIPSPLNPPVFPTPPKKTCNEKSDQV